MRRGQSKALKRKNDTTRTESSCRSTGADRFRCVAASKPSYRSNKSTRQANCTDDAAHHHTQYKSLILLHLAEEVGFEPTESLHPRRFSRPVPSTTRPLFPKATTHGHHFGQTYALMHGSFQASFVEQCNIRTGIATIWPASCPIRLRQ